MSDYPCIELVPRADEILGGSYQFISDFVGSALFLIRVILSSVSHVALSSVIRSRTTLLRVGPFECLWLERLPVERSFLQNESLVFVWVSIDNRLLVFHGPLYSLIELNGENGKKLKFGF